MLLRDLKMKPREEKRYFDCCWVGLSDGSGLYVQRVHQSTRYAPGTWFIFHHECCGDHGSNIRRNRYEMDEFEAQAVLDHYLQLHGVTDETV